LIYRAFIQPDTGSVIRSVVRCLIMKWKILLPDRPARSRFTPFMYFHIKGFRDLGDRFYSIQTLPALFIYERKREIIMRSLLYIIAVILVIGWLIGFVGYAAGGLIHLLLVIAVIAVLIDVIGGRRSIA
jgi:hypothetical protein